MGCIPILPVKHYGNDDDVARCEWAFKDPTPSGTTYIPVFCRLLLRSLEILNPPKPLLFLSPAEIFFVSWKPYTLLITFLQCPPSPDAAPLYTPWFLTKSLLHYTLSGTSCSHLSPPTTACSRRPAFNILCIYSVSDPDSYRWSIVPPFIHPLHIHIHINPYMERQKKRQL